MRGGAQLASARAFAHALACAAIALALASPARAADPKPDAPAAKPGPDGWYDAAPPDASFEVRLPGAFEATVDDGPDDEGVLMHSSGVRATVPGAFGGSTAYAAHCNRLEGEARTPRERVLAGVEQWEKLRPLQYRKPIEQHGVAGIEFQLKDDVKVMRARIVAPPDGRTCTVLLHWRPFAKPREADVAKYLDSFRVRAR
ncbi:MAG: hypothetical protein DCC71_22445 [Proteobacteria bacterium]|nr:MAG: hypothetical protein DCC71_22445 [Pseudomonadota bacterium]